MTLRTPRRTILVLATVAVAFHASSYLRCNAAPDSEAADRTLHQLKVLASEIEVRWYYEDRLVVGLPELIQGQERFGKAEAAALRYDAWRSEIRIQQAGDKVILCSAGPDAVFGTGDDISHVLVLRPRHGTGITRAS